MATKEAREKHDFKKLRVKEERADLTRSLRS